MNDLWHQFKDWLVILGFPCNQFGHQENGDGEEIVQSLRHVRPGNNFEPKVTLMQKVEVNGSGSHPIFRFLREKLPTPHDEAFVLMKDPRLITWSPVSRTDISWNFEKFLINKEGRPYRRYSSRFPTAELKHIIQALIHQ